MNTQKVTRFFHFFDEKKFKLFFMRCLQGLVLITVKKNELHNDLKSYNLPLTNKYEFLIVKNGFEQNKSIS